MQAMLFQLTKPVSKFESALINKTQLKETTLNPESLLRMKELPKD
jgi:hypothetical protein